MWNNAFFVTEKSGFHDIVVRLRHDVTKEVGFHNGDSFFEKSELSLLPYIQASVSRNPQQIHYIGSSGSNGSET